MAHPDDLPTASEPPKPSEPSARRERHLPDAIGPYRIVEVLGEGGMGMVYLAEQAEPIRRRVALKVIKPGMDSAGVLGRFDAERQALALMDHPSIARVLDAGMTTDGRPFFVMEHVKGVPITTHADRHRLSIEERLELFAQVCSAVHHAHQKGIIHRDIKPSNVLVAYADDVAVVKVIDFGIAKAVNQPLVEQTMFTRHGQLIGTPEYMSPEQAEMSAQDIDTRTDIYSLGVVLYELLAGSLPFDPESLRSIGLHEIHRVIREVEPAKPSTRVSSVRADSTESLATISKARRADSRSLSKRLRGDLDWIVMKCLEKDRRRRYDSASALADDIRHYLRNEPVTAGPPSAVYRLRKFTRRHRASVATAALLALAILTGLALTTWQWRRAEAALAEARASDARARGIANSLIDRFHDDVVPLPGSAAVRDGFVSDALTLLQEMERTSTDPTLWLDIADGYDRISEVRAGLRTAHIGDLDAARTGFDKARDLRTRAAAAAPNAGGRIAVGLAMSSLYAGDLDREQEALDASIAAYRDGLARLDSVPSGVVPADQLARTRALLQVALANALGRTDAPTAERADLLTSAVALLRPLATATPTRDNRWALARALTNLGEYFLGAGDDLGRALATLDEAAAQWRAILDTRPSDSLVRHDLAGTEYWRAAALRSLKRDADADAAWSESARHYGFLVEADPTDRRAALGLARVLEATGNAVRTTNPALAVERFADAVAAVERFRPEAQRDTALLRIQGSCQYLLARTLLTLTPPDAPRALDTIRRAYATLDALDRIAPGDEEFTRRRLADSAQVWMAALNALPEGEAAPNGAAMEDARVLFTATVARWNDAGGSIEESKAHQRLTDLLGSPR